ncbi:extracellular solute-binding protein [Deinococcus sp. YIM 134068]|uniref:extracellular solute-binding protein n=1 Tax=Deinococcus lichenicola TaxID=3118910 RepID=UPI002F95F18A
MSNPSPRILTVVLALAASTAEARTTLDVLWFTVSPADQFLPEKYARRYEALHPDVEVRFNFVPHNGLTQRLQVMIAGQTPPDVTRVMTANISEFAPAALDLTGTVSPDEFTGLQQNYMRQGAGSSARPST